VGRLPTGTLRRATSIAFNGLARLAVAIAVAAVWLLVVGRLLTAATGGAGRPMPLRLLVTLLGGHVIVLLGVACVAAVVLLLLLVLGRRGGRWGRSPWLAGAVFGLLAVVPFAVVGHLLASGRWISQQSFAWLVRWLPAVLGAGLWTIVGWVSFAFVGDDDAHRRRRAFLVTALLGASIACSLVDALVMPELYPAFHALVYAMSAAFAFLASTRALKVATRAPLPLVVGVAGTIATVVIVASAALWLTMSQRDRGELLLRSPFAATAIRATAPSPTSYLHSELAGLDVTAGRLELHASHRRGLLSVPEDVNVILVTVDALRADTLPPVRDGRASPMRRGDTPFLERWIAGSFRFSHVYAQASYTMPSLPAMFSSLESFESVSNRGTSLATYVSRLDRAPVAVINRYFVEEADGRELLQGFEQVRIIENHEMSTAVDTLVELVDDVRDRPFLGWVHLFNLHAPGYDGGMMNRRDGTWRRRYRLSVRWLDGEIERLVAEIARLGLEDETVVILASDHGEGLGDNRIQLHGETVFEEEVRVPLVIHVPGHDGGQIDAVVGNIDIVPTIGDLLGAPMEPRHRGRSLVPLLVDPGARWNREYYVQSRRDVVAIVAGRDKLVYDTAGDVFLRFDLASDPREDENLHGSDDRLDRQLRSALVRHNPALFAHELANPRTDALLLQRLWEVHADQPGESLSFLLRVAALRPAEVTSRQVFRIFEETSSDEVRFRVIEHMFDIDPEGWSGALGAHLETLSRRPEELAFVQRLAPLGLPAFAVETIADKMRFWVERGEPETWRPWLALIRHWPTKRGEDFGEPLKAILEAAMGDEETVPPAVVELALCNVATLVTTEGTGADLAASVSPFLDHPDPRVQVAACAALATVGGEGSVAALARKLDDANADVRVLQAAVKALARDGGDAAVATIIAHADDPRLTFYAIRLLGKTGNPAALPYLRETSTDHEEGRIRAVAIHAIRKLEKAQK
jgi:hypothetical protein